MTKRKPRHRKRVNRVLIERVKPASPKALILVAMFAFVGVIALLMLRAAPTDFSPGTLATSPARKGQPYNAVLAYASPATWSVASGTLPPGLNLSSGGQISGTPTQAGAFTFVVRAQPSSGPAETKPYTIIVHPGAAYGYEQRAREVIESHFNSPWPHITGCTDHIGFLNYGMAALWLNQNTADANNKLTQVRMSRLIGMCTTPDPRNNLWHNLLLRPYLLFDDSSSYYPGRLSQAAGDNIVAQAWSYAKEHSDMNEAIDPWSIHDSENHDVQGEAFYFLAAQIFKNRDDYKNRTYDLGGTPAQHYAAWRDHWSRFLDERAKKGLFIEAGSPTYHGYTMQGIINIYNFAEDPALRKKAEMVLDIDFADYAQNQLNSIWGGGKSRSYPDDSYDGFGDSMTRFGEMLFGPVAPRRSNHTMFLATSGYFPPDLVYEMANNPAQRGTYEYVTRRPGAGPRNWDNKLNYHPDINKSVLHYSYVTPDYILGSALIKPGQQYTAISAQNRWQGVIFNTTSDAKVYPLAAPPSLDRTFDSWVAVQKNNTLLMRKQGDLDKASLVYFAQSLDVIDEESGWLFVREGSAYVAVRPANGSYTWLTASKNQDANIANRYVRLATSSSPIIFEAARASQYANFEAFKTDIKNNTRNYSNGVLDYTASDGTQLNIAISGTNAPMINSQPVNYSPGKVYNSPFIDSNWNSGVIELSYGDLRANYDFRDTNNPFKSVTAVTIPDPPPTITTVTPNTGGVEGGNTVTITGANFVSGASVHFGFLLASNITVVNSATITVTVPATSAAGPINLVITNPDGQRVVKGSAYTYTSGDTTSPTVFIAAPANNAQLKQSAALSAGADDNVGVTKVEFFVNGTGPDDLIGEASRSFVGWIIMWDTRTVANGAYTLRAKAFDAAGNATTSAPITVTVANYRGEDINEDGVVNLLDFSLLSSKFGQSSNLGRTDINQDGVVNLLDFSLLAGQFGT